MYVDFHLLLLNGLPIFNRETGLWIKHLPAKESLKDIKFSIQIFLSFGNSIIDKKQKYGVRAPKPWYTESIESCDGRTLSSIVEYRMKYDRDSEFFVRII